MHKPIGIFSWASLLAGLLAAVLFFTAFSTILFQDVVVTTGGDGIKNYFTPVYSVEYGDGPWFDGMHYPYGDNVLYTDNQPAVSHLISMLSGPLNIEGYEVPRWLHSFMLISFSLCAMLMCSILSRWIPSRMGSIVIAVIITCMAPQLERMYAHFSLAYIAFFPLVWWSILQVRDLPKRWSSYLFVFLSLFLFAFIHLYYLLIALMFVLLMVILWQFRKELSLKHSVATLIAAFLPFVLVLIYTKLTDPVTDRPEQPFGFFFYKATFQSVFIPPSGFLHNFWRNQLHGGRVNMEGYAWVGHAGLIVAGLALFAGIAHLIKRKYKAISIPKSMRSSVIAALLVLAFSMTLPFSLGLDGLLDVIPFIQQFRSPGRFAWVFYFVFSAWMGVVIMNWLTGHKRFFKIASIILLMLWGFDSFSYFYRTGNNISKGADANPFNPVQTELISTIVQDPNTYQAIVQMPFYHLGSEKLYIEKGAHNMVEGMSAVYATGLPMINNMASRTSIGQSLEVSALVGHPLIEKKLPNGFDERPLLLISQNDELNIPEQFLINRGTLLGEREGFSYYSLPLSAFKHTQNELLNDFFALKDSIYIDRGEYYSKQELNFFATHYDVDIDFDVDFDVDKDVDKDVDVDHAERYGFYREGGEELLLEVEVTPLDSTTWMEVSFWNYTFNETTAYPPIKIEWLKVDGTVFRREDVSAKTSTDIIGRWVRASGYFEVQPDCASIRLTLLDHPRTLINNILVRDTRENVFYRVNDGALWFNNFPIND